MRFTALIAFFTIASFALAGNCAAQNTQSQPPSVPPDNQQSTPMQRQSPNHEWQMRGCTMMGPGMGRMPRIMMRSQQIKRNGGWGGPLRIFSTLESDLDNPRIQTALGLSQQQVTSLRDILVNTEIYTIQNGSSILVDGIQLKQLLRSDHPDKGAVTAKGNAISQSVSQIINHYLDAILDAKTILTPQQQDMIRRYMAMHRSNFGGFGDMRMGMGRSGPRTQSQ